MRAGQPRGTIWIVAHDGDRRFDAEDVRVMASLADFTRAALRSASDRAAAQEAARCERTARAAAEAEAAVTRKDAGILREQTQAMAEADRNKDAFLGQLAHELRNPLASLFNALHAIRLQGSDAAMRERSLDLGTRQVQQLGRLIDGLLDLARVRQGKMELKMQVVDLNAVVARAVETARPAIEGRCHDLEVAAPRGPVLLQADPARLEQVLVNLLHNAAKYTEVGGRIRLTIERGEGESVIRVRDTGIGLNPEMVQRVFHLYSQDERGREMSQGGLGIGLSLVRGLVELHGGRVQAFSDGPGRGSEFMVCLPTPPQSLPPRNAAQERPGVTGAALRVLLVDDNLDSSDSLAMLPAALGPPRRCRPRWPCRPGGREGVDAGSGPPRHRPAGHGWA